MHEISERISVNVGVGRLLFREVFNYVYIYT
jgi:hypothetical protein